jgi:hypothetical protein
MFAHGRRPIPLSLARRNATPPYGAGIASPAKPQAKRGQNQIIRRHALLLPDPPTQAKQEVQALGFFLAKILKKNLSSDATAESGKARPPPLYWGKDRGNEPCDI